jgi:hypothetical protein
MRLSILSWYSTSSSLPTPQALSTRPRTKPPSIVSFTPIFSVPLPPPSFFAPPTLTEALSITASRPPAEEIVPLVLAIQQYTLGCLFRAELTADEVGKRAEGLGALVGKDGSPLAWRSVLEKEMAEGTLTEADKEVVLKRVDAMMTSMFGTLTKGCVGAETLVGTFPLHLRETPSYQRFTSDSPRNTPHDPIPGSPILRHQSSPLRRAGKARRLLRPNAQGSPSLWPPSRTEKA